MKSGALDSGGLMMITMIVLTGLTDILEDIAYVGYLYAEKRMKKRKYCGRRCKVASLRDGREEGWVRADKGDAAAAALE